MGIIRLLLALSVVFAHSGPFILTGNQFVGGLVAVEAFFMISGFYMALVLETKYTNQIKNFYWNRFLRIFPSYWAVLILAIFAGFIVPEVNALGKLSASNPTASTGILMLISNFFIFGSDLMMFLSSNENGLFFVDNFMKVDPQLNHFHYIPQAWSLPLELMFYLVAPFIVRSTKTVVAILMVSLIIKAVTLQYFGFNDPWTYRFFPSEIGIFCLGVLSYKSLSFFKGKLDVAKFGTFFLLAIVLSTMFFSSISVFAVLKTPLYLALLAIGLPFVFDRFKSNRLDRALGELSYPIYLSHLLVLGAVRYLGASLGGDQSLIILFGCLITGLFLTYMVSVPVEKNLRALGAS